MINGTGQHIFMMAEPSLNELGIQSDFDTGGSNASATYLAPHQLEMSAQEGKTVDHNCPVPCMQITEKPCQWILYWGINYSTVRVWDVMILTPNTFFLLFLLGRLRPNIRQLQASSSPMFTAFYGLVCMVSIVSVLRCIVSMTVDPTVEAGDIADKMLWLVLRFFLLSTEASVITFGFYFGYLDSRSSIQRVLVCTSFFALVYSVVQGTLEMEYRHDDFNVKDLDNGTDNFDLFAHGGMIFLGTSSAFFCVVYVTILILPLTCIKEKLVLPSKPSFYYYVATLAVLNLTQAMGSLLLYKHISHALCVIDVTTYIYFTLFDPLVYITFLWNFFRTRHSGSTILFSYKHQEEDLQHTSQLNLPSNNLPFPAKGDNRELNSTSDYFRSISTPVDSPPKENVSGSPLTRPPTPFLCLNRDC